MGIETALGVGAGVQLVGGIIQGEAAARGARAEQRQAQADRDLALQYAAPSPEELAQLRTAIETNDKDIARKQAILDSTDPAIIEAGKQALQLLQGEDAKTLDPLRRQRAEQREILQDRLRDQLGSGYETSSAGIKALNDFDAETSSVLAQEQDRSLGRLLGVAQDFSSRGLDSNVQNATTIAGLFGNIQGRRVNAITGTPLAQYAGAPYVGQGQFGQVLTGIGRSAVQGATMGAVLGRFAPTAGGTVHASGTSTAGAVGGGISPVSSSIYRNPTVRMGPEGI